MLWYDRPQPGMKRSAHQAALDAYSMIDSCSYYNHLQPPAVKYMKPEPVTYYQYAEDPERYQTNIAVSAQSNQVHPTLSSGPLANYTPSHYASYSTAAAVAAAAAAAYGSLPTESCNVYSLGQHVSQHAVAPSQVTSASEPQAVSPAQPSQVEDTTTTNITAPLTPPLSVSPVMGHVGGGSPAPPCSMAANSNTSGYGDKDANYRSGTGSPCERADCDSTTHMLAEGDIIPKLPLHVLSDLSEGLPLPGQ